MARGMTREFATVPIRSSHSRGEVGRQIARDNEDIKAVFLQADGGCEADHTAANNDNWLSHTIYTF